ncbi:pyridoxamine 5'-phosphate oxidase family protein [Thermophilibacter sp.]
MRAMRRAKQQLNDEACREVLERGRECVLALAGSEATDGFPYAVPVNYAYVPAGEGETGALGHLLIHCAPTGAKLDAVAADARVSACVIDRADVVPEKLTTYFRSVIAFGRARLVEDDGARRAALVALADKYAPELAADAVDAEVERFFARVAILDVTLERVTGKQCIELV